MFLLELGCVCCDCCFILLSQFKADPNLENSLMKWGKNALKELGYLNMEEYYENIEKEFSKRFLIAFNINSAVYLMCRLYRIDGKYQCKLTKVQCLAKGRGVKDWKDAKLKRYTPADGADRLCAFDDNVDYRGGGPDINILIATSQFNLFA